MTDSSQSERDEIEAIKPRLRAYFANLNGEIRIGSLIGELQVDYSPLLEALYELEGEGVIVCDPNAGSYFPAHLVPPEDEDEA